ncbi:MAG: site-specific integrase [Desulfotomaculaceae bacterium]|nr:site-specific integrase [Desulfotomaculaceae bacterium]
MKTVQPIRDLKKIDVMKKILLASPYGLRNHLLFVLGINSGLRISDLLNLRLVDVVDDKGKPVDRITIREKKTGKEKDFPLGKSAIKAIKLYVDSLSKIDLNQALFPSRKGGQPLSRVQAWEILNNAAMNVGINESIGTHSLRKTFGYHAFKAGYDITKIQKLLNHSSPAITLAYIGITQDELDEVYLTLNL